jgi:hypothetical protein
VNAATLLDEILVFDVLYLDLNVHNKWMHTLVQEELHLLMSGLEIHWSQVKAAVPHWS